MSSDASAGQSTDDVRTPSEAAGKQLMQRASAASVSGELPASTFEMRPNPRNSFKGAQVKEIVNEVLNDTLHGKVYAVGQVPEWTRSLADDISARCKELEMRRFKHVVQVVLAQQNGAGCKYIARCRWDAECDSQVSSYFSNESMVCVVSVFGVYLY